MKRLFSVLRDERGVTAMEYGMIAALVAVGIIFALSNLGEELARTFTTISDTLRAANDEAR